MRPQALIRDTAGVLPMLGLLAAAYLLPPDTSLSEVRAGGALRACVPSVHPPFVTGDALTPGIDLEILHALARELGLMLVPAEESAISRDFNPRSWHLTRAACELIAGGLAATPMTRSFLETSTPYAQTGWAVVAPQRLADLHRLRIGVLAPASGLDRIALTSYLRGEAAQVALLPDVDALIGGLHERRFEAAITEKLLADSVASHERWVADWLAELPRYPVAFGLWKGDLTLKRAVNAGLERLRREGTLETTLERYVGVRNALSG